MPAIMALCCVGIEHSSAVNFWITIVRSTVISLFTIFCIHHTVPARGHPFVPDRVCAVAGAPGGMRRPGKYG